MDGGDFRADRGRMARLTASDSNDLLAHWPDGETVEVETPGGIQLHYFLAYSDWGELLFIFWRDTGGTYLRGDRWTARVAKGATLADVVPDENRFPLILLCHKIRDAELAVEAADRRQHGHRGGIAVSRRAICQRRVASEFGVCRSGLVGRAARAEAFGHARRLRPPAWPWGGIGLRSEPRNP